MAWPRDPTPMTPQGFAAATAVSRETRRRLETYVALVAKWNRAVSLTAPSTLPDIWRRHVLDSAQLAPLLAPDTRTIIDIGSGAGFPGMVLALMTDAEVHLVESNQRKCAFLNEVRRRTGARVAVHAQRVENLAPFRVDAATARAVAPVAQLLDHAAPFVGESGRCLFLKSQDVGSELTEATKSWTMRVESTPSRTHPDGVILSIGGLRREPDKRRSGRQPS